MRITLPNLLAINTTSVRGDSIRQLAQGKPALEGSLASFSRGKLHGFLFQPTDASGEILIVSEPSKQLPDSCTRIVLAEGFDGQQGDISSGSWLRHPVSNASATADSKSLLTQIVESWANAFSFVAEDASRSVIGLRKPQLGALHAIHAHWSTSHATGTIVMPTGTGKTDTMLSVLVSARCERVLVIVPTDALRAQIAHKFLTLGILKHPQTSLLRPDALFPVVCTLEHFPRSVDEVDAILTRALVIVTTSAIAGQCAPEVQSRFAHHCPYLFIDEAHHAEAPTWSAFKDQFRHCRVLQFTATPFREDGKPLDGEIIYRYSLKRAQEDGYFKPIQFEPVVAYDHKKADSAIANRAVEQLRADYSKGHIVMARVDTIARANEVLKLYEKYPEFNPVALHTGITPRERKASRGQILSGASRIVVCVDMLGEGFDLPELKIAAFHDIRKTLAVTLQLAGRFTRARTDLGNATFIANTGDVQVRDELRKLYTRDPDWNVLLPQLSDKIIGEQISLQAFLQGFTQFADEIPLRTVQPAASVVVYRTRCGDWSPERFREGIQSIDSCELLHHTINPAENTIVIVTARRVVPPWSTAENLESWDWELYVAFWCREQQLLFINGSSNASAFKSLAYALAGEDAILIRGNDVFRSFAGINRLRLQNVGLTEQFGKQVRYTGRMGSDVGPGLPDVNRRSASKSVLSGSGYENGVATTIGASRKGRIWSHRRERIDQLVLWCKELGKKLLDTSIDPDEILKGTLEAKTITERPDKMPICVDWPEEIYTSPEGNWTLVIGDQDCPIGEVGIAVASPTRLGNLRLSITAEVAQAELELLLFTADDEPNYRFDLKGDTKVHIRRGDRSRPEPIADFFYDNPPIIWFHDGSMLEGNQLTEPSTKHPPYDASKIQVWDWTGTDITRESQGIRKAADTVQARVIRELQLRDYEVIVDDDNSGEAADIVAIKRDGDLEAPSSIRVEFYHCKFSRKPVAGHRIEDLYEVCGQAQKSIAWMASPEKRTDLFAHLLRRDERRQGTSGTSRLERGTGDLLYVIQEMSRFCPIDLSIAIVQPGLSKAEASRDQLELLSVTENHLFETFRIPFSVIASA